MANKIESIYQKRGMNYAAKLLSRIKKENCLKDIDAVIFPKYLADGKNRVNKLTVKDAFKKIINPIRAYDDMKTMFMDIKKLAINSDCYEMEYASSNSACKLLCDEVFHCVDS